MSPSAAAIDPQTAMGAVRLRVADIETVGRFYERAIGLEVIESTASEARLGVGGRVLVELASAPGATPRPRRSTGLFHLALLVGDRARLGAALRRLAQAEWGLTGASDHLVSEALYTNDPEGNGIEIYRDRPRAEWTWVDGVVQMDTLPLNLESVLAEHDPAADGPMGPETQMGHVHLNVADIPDADAFYCDVLGFQATVRGYPGALFVAAGGYHHHLGLNTWVGAGAPPPPAGSRGLELFEIVVPAAQDVTAAAARLEARGVEAHEQPGGALHFADPFGNGISIRAAGETKGVGD